ncbi:hypothetical protein CI109_102858 [Kwoniella shandongensis]|uniref:Pre-rRNA-processing protein n=1 Tax=Kwoniella shandongensis TaxID=1734106 RepID=A0A5M6C9B5_9TREE|nr:uncharacterized protein CI109_000048 [Kwoniella shandongensis]KAA5531210.1 hypothetical protein CI109_000048 [Kwoniella shandongensis]
MPKATKKKKEKHADFAKAKLKLGKGKQAASNATDTSFKARSIALPGQEALARAARVEDGSGPSEPTTANGLTLDDLIIRFRHPNAGVRKESLGGVKEILGVEVGRETGKVLRALGGLISDDDASVRKALIALLGWYLAQVPVSTLSPHLPLLVLQTSSALSHIFPEIRLDGCKLVHLLLQHVPSHVVGSWPHEPSNILEGLRLAVGLGGEKGVNSQIGRLTGGAKLVTMRAMSEFVRRGLGIGLEVEKGKWKEGWEESGSRGKGRGKQRTVKADGGADLSEEGWLAAGKCWDVEAELENGWEIGRLGQQGGKGDEDNVVGVVSQLYIQLHPLLLSTFLESAPTAFSPSSTSSFSSSSANATEDIPLALCNTTASLTELLARAILTRAPPNPSPELKEVRSCVSDFLKRMAAWFPFRSPKSQALTPSGLSPGFELSLAYSNLAVLLAPRPPALVWPETTTSKGGPARQSRSAMRVKAVETAWGKMRETARDTGKGKGKASSADNWAMEEVAEWVKDVLAPTKDALAPSLTPAAYSALLPIIWALLVQPPAQPVSEDDIPTSVGTAFLTHLTRQAATSAIRNVGDEFVISLIDIHEQRYPTLPFYIQVNSPLHDLFGRWFENVPKILWELGTRDEGSTEKLLRFLLDIGSRGQGGSASSLELLGVEVFPSISGKLAAFYHIQHPTKGSVPGPWTKLVQPPIKKIGLDVARVWIEWDKEGRLGDAVGRGCKAAGKEWEGYWTR